MATIHSRTDQRSMLTGLQWAFYRNTDSGRWCRNVSTATHFLLQTLASLLGDVILQELIFFSCGAIHGRKRTRHVQPAFLS